MGTLGTYLREAREAKGIDLREAAQQTRISVNYLGAIESEDFAKLPGEVFVKGFLKNYAKFLGLSEAEVMKRYGETKVPTPQEQAAASKVERARNADQVAGRYEVSIPRHTMEPYLWGAVALFAIIAVLFVVVPRQRAPKEHAEPVSSITHTAEVVTGPVQTVLKDKLYLEIEAVEDTWILVRTDASPLKKAVLRKGEIVTWSADERFLLSFGGIDTVILRLNGRELSVAGPRGAVIRDLMITAAGIITPKADAAPRPPRKPKPEVATAPSATAGQATASQKAVTKPVATTLGTAARTTTAPVKTVPATTAPVTPAPVTPAPATTAPATTAPATTAPATTAPATTTEPVAPSNVSGE